MEIGSIYEINPEKTGERESKGFHLKEVQKWNNHHIVYTGSGREAIACVLEGLEKAGKAGRKVCLLPGYMCDSVYLPFENAGWELHFYHIHKNMKADREELERLLSEISPTLLLIHCYYGVDTWRELRPFLKEWREKGLFIMEDMTQSYYLCGKEMEADFYVGSLRKWYAVPDGGFAASASLPLKTPDTEGSDFSRRKVEILEKKWNYLKESGQLGDDNEKKQEAKLSEKSAEDLQKEKNWYLTENRKMEEWLDEKREIDGISPAARYLLEREDEDFCKKRRQENAKILLKGLREIKNLTPVFPEWMGKDEKEEAPAPLYMPVYVKGDRSDFQSYCGAHGIYIPVLWPVPSQIEGWLSEEETEIYDTILALPCDQRYGKKEMEYMLAVMKSYSPKEWIGIRADANEEIATGHIMRCLTIGASLEKLGQKVVFFTADRQADSLILPTGRKRVCLHTDWRDKEGELPVLEQALKEWNCTRLLVDSYQVSPVYLKQLGRLCRTAYIDDLFENIWPADLVINYNAYAGQFPYHEKYTENTRLLLGASYVPLRPEFLEKRPKPEAEEKTAVSRETEPGSGADSKEKHRLKVLLICGGGDVYNSLSGMVAAFRKEPWFDKIEFRVVVGGFNRFREQLEQQTQGVENVHLLYNVTDMAGLMAECDMAVSAASTVLYELCAMGLPTVFFVCVDNQKYDKDFFGKQERMIYAGDIRQDRENCLHRMAEGVRLLWENPELRQTMRQRLLHIVDGLGADRIAEEMIKGEKR